MWRELDQNIQRSVLLIPCIFCAFAWVIDGDYQRSRYVWIRGNLWIKMIMQFNLTHVVGSTLPKPCFLGNVSESCGWFGLGGNSVINSSHVGGVAVRLRKNTFANIMSCNIWREKVKARSPLKHGTHIALCLLSSTYYRSVSNCENSIHYNIDSFIDWEVNIKMSRENKH